MKRKDTREVHILGDGWEYKIGRNTVAIYSPDGERYFPKFGEIVGEKAVENENFYLNPAVIKEHIKTKILGMEETLKRCSSCGQKKTDVRLRANPFNLEIYDDYTKKLYCDDCIDSFADDI